MDGDRLIDLGVLDYPSASRQQLELVTARQLGEGKDTLLLVEHPHVITVGRSHKAWANVLAAGEVPVVEVERGGDVTYHGPGQLVAYPILWLGPGERDLHRFLRNLEQAVVATLVDLGLPGAGRRDGATGVWIDGSRKIASIGVACRRWVTFHGLALNVATDLSYFRRIHPCGFDASVMTSLQALGHSAALAEVKPVLARRLGESLGRSFVRA